MDIQEKKVSIRELTADYYNDAEEGVRGYHDQLDIRPQYQREFVYKDKQRDEVIRTVMKGLPLNIMYWVDRGAKFVQDNPDEPRYEVMDGQQRTISICEYVDGSYSVDNKYFENQPADIREKILNYELFIYVCSGTDSEKLDWFRIINIAGEQLTDQELRNAVYAGPFISDAKRYISKTGCAASIFADAYLRGSSIRQEYLETAIEWDAARSGLSIDEYMALHQYDATAVGLWNYFRSVIDWVKATFPVKRKEMRGLPWGIYYNENHGRTDLDPGALEARISALMADNDVTRKAGAYEYVLDGNEKALSIRVFSDSDKRTAYERQHGRCAICGKEASMEEMHADHIVPWSKGGHTTLDNLQLLCRDCNLKKGAQSQPSATEAAGLKEHPHMHSVR